MITRWTTPARWCGLLLWVGLAVLGGGLLGAAPPGQAQVSSESPPLSGVSPQPLLRAGDSGPQVSQLQLELASLGFYAQTVDGIYGADTVAAVRSLQQRQGIASDGVVGRQTWLALEAALRQGILKLPVPMLQANTLVFTPLVVATPAPPPSALWLALMPLVPIVGGLLTYLHRRLQHQQIFQRQRPRRRSPPKPRLPR
ncbi:peptidoglycan-binding domain-containing protein [Nodosilinea nodulosa]|uniref:peptidoglycan-binding domain-containing protein n=1 Tax=Nodosilinea nodulosa TaxID=416001 RepID=UPI0003181B8C|nr:peptidoglycan-binding protein [Nodosilinea nodulosa]